MAAEIKLNFDVTGLGQSTSSTCWYACYRMLHKWKNADDSQIRTKLEGIGLKWSELITRGIYKEELVRAGHSLGLIGLAVSAAGMVAGSLLPQWVGHRMPTHELHERMHHHAAAETHHVTEHPHPHHPPHGG